MRLKQLSRLGLLTLLSLGMVPAMAHAQEGAAATKIAVANPASIFVQMQERKDLMAAMEKERATLADEEKTRLEALKTMEEDRKNLHVGSPQYQAKSQEIIEKTIDLQTWREVHKADLQRQQKNEMRNLYQKIEDAITTLAQAENYDLVIAEQKPDFPDDLDQITVENLRNIITARNIIYAKRGVDISDRVITALDAKYNRH